VKQAATSLPQTLDMNFFYEEIWDLVAWQNKCLSVSSDHVEVWCVPSASHVPYRHTVLSIRVVVTLFSEFYDSHPIVLILLCRN
jgi:hypothetical protein